jgi:3-deoxy-D-manno-octulosonic-acid transferase
VRLPLSLRLYSLATGLAEPIAPLLLRARARRGKEEAARLPERLGHASLPRPAGPLAWLHGASVGESLSLLPLIERLRRDRPDLTILVTSGTVTSAEMMRRRLPQGVIHQYCPVDAPRAAGRFVTHWKPDLVVFVESELWPNLLLAAKAHGAKLALVSARMTEASAEGWRRSPASARTLLTAFDLMLPQDAAAAERLTGLGARDDGRLNLKYAGDPLPADAAALTALKAAVGERPVLVTASTHMGEEEKVLDAFAPHLDHPSRPLLVIVPRHPERGDWIDDLTEARGFSSARRGAGGQVAADVEVYVADTLGEMGLWLSLANTALVGGSMVEGVGGHNPLEPIRLGCPALTGPYVASWQGVYDSLFAAGAVEVTASAAELAAAFGRALAGKDETRLKAARAVAARQAKALEAGLTRLEGLLL